MAGEVEEAVLRELQRFVRPHGQRQRPLALEALHAAVELIAGLREQRYLQRGVSAARPVDQTGRLPVVTRVGDAPEGLLGDDGDVHDATVAVGAHQRREVIGDDVRGRLREWGRWWVGNGAQGGHRRGRLK